MSQNIGGHRPTNKARRSALPRSSWSTVLPRITIRRTALSSPAKPHGSARCAPRRVAAIRSSSSVASLPARSRCPLCDDLLMTTEGVVEDRRDPAPAPPPRRPATAAAAPPEPELGRPGHARDPARVIPKARRHGLRLLITPIRSCAGTATSSTAAGPPGPFAAGPAGRQPAGTSGHWCSGSPARAGTGAATDAHWARSVSSTAMSRSSMTARPCSASSAASSGSHGLAAGDPVSGVDSPASSACR